MAGVPAGAPRVYTFPRLGLVSFAVDLVLGRRRSFHRDCKRTIARVRPAPRVLGEEHIPAEGPFVLVANHYERPGLNVHFAGMLASLAIGRRRPESPEVRWVITSQWFGRRLGPVPVPDVFWRWLFRRVARLYGFVVMPRLEEQTMGRALALRRAAAYALQRGEPLSLMPEGVGKGVLIEAQPGVGTFLKVLSDRGIPVLPAGLWEDADGALTASFGPAFSIAKQPAQRGSEADRLARVRVMVAIGRQLPRPYWGFYAEAIEGEDRRGLC